MSDEIQHQKTRIVRLPDSEEIMTLTFFVLMQYRRVTDRKADGRTRCSRKDLRWHSVARVKTQAQKTYSRTMDGVATRRRRPTGYSLTFDVPDSAAGRPDSRIFDKHHPVWSIMRGFRLAERQLCRSVCRPHGRRNFQSNSGSVERSVGMQAETTHAVLPPPTHTHCRFTCYFVLRLIQIIPTSTIVRLNTPQNHSVISVALSSSFPVCLEISRHV